jgi:3-oxoacyl-[acyl-carrier-protein] synthase II
MMDKKKRIVVTGIGLVTPLGCQKDIIWERLISGQSGISAINSFDASGFPSRIAGQITDDLSWLGEKMSLKEQKRVGRFILLGIAAAIRALEDARWSPSSDADRERTAMVVGSGIGGLPEIEKAALTLNQNGPSRVSPFFVPSALINLIAGHISMIYGFKGPLTSIATACSSGTHAIGEAMKMIIYNQADVVIAGGAEAAVCPLGIEGFSSMRALSSHFNETPERASRPFDKKRDGFVIAEGAGILILESLEHALARKAFIYGEIIGYGASADAYHIASPPEDGQGAYQSMERALISAGIKPEEIGYINAHGTSTPPGDLAELRAIERLFPRNTKVSSTKSSIGHLLGAAGSVEAAFTLMALNQQILPATLNLDDPEETHLDLIPHTAQPVSGLRYALSNSFGFGGTNASIIFSRYFP